MSENAPAKIKWSAKGKVDHQKGGSPTNDEPPF